MAPAVGPQLVIPAGLPRNVEAAIHDNANVSAGGNLTVAASSNNYFDGRALAGQGGSVGIGAAVTATVAASSLSIRRFQTPAICSTLVEIPVRFVFMSIRAFSPAATSC